MNLKELAELTHYLDTATSMRDKKIEFLRIRGTQVSRCFTDFSVADNGVVIIFFSLVFTYENPEKEIFITETKSEVTTDEIVLTDYFKEILLKGLEDKIDLFLDRISPYLK